MEAIGIVGFFEDRHVLGSFCLDVADFVVCVVGVGQEAVFVVVVGVFSVGHATLASLARTSKEREPFF